MATKPKKESTSRTIEFGPMRVKVGRQDRVLFAYFDSSNIAAAAYNIDLSELYVAFKSAPNTLYTYSGVTQKVFLSMINAESVGSYFARNIKSKYEFYDEEI